MEVGLENTGMTQTTMLVVVLMVIVFIIFIAVAVGWKFRQVRNVPALTGPTAQVITHSFYKQLHFRPSETQIFENRSKLASNCRASNRKFLATFEPQI